MKKLVLIIIFIYPCVSPSQIGIDSYYKLRLGMTVKQVEELVDSSFTSKTLKKKIEYDLTKSDKITELEYNYVKIGNYLQKVVLTFHNDNLYLIIAIFDTINIPNKLSLIICREATYQRLYMIHGRPYESGADINLAYVDVFRSKNPLTMLHTKFTGETLEEKYVEYRFIAWFSITIFNSYLFDYISKIEKNNSKKDNKDKKKK